MVKNENNFVVNSVSNSVKGASFIYGSKSNKFSRHLRNCIDGAASNPIPTRRTGNKLG